MVAGGTAGVILTQGGGDGRNPAGVKLPGARPAAAGEETRPLSGMFPADTSAKGDGRDQELTAVATSGQTVVAVGADRDPQGGGARALFVVSTDGGHTWKASGVPGGGAVPRWVAGTEGGWLAGAADGTLWRSPDGLAWERGAEGAGKVFGPADRIIGVVSSPKGWVAIGLTPSPLPLKAVPVMWTSTDGAVWKRLSGGFPLPAADELVALTRISAGGSGITLEGIRMKHLEKTPFQRDVVWTSDNGGQSWDVMSKTENRAVTRPESAYDLIPGPAAGTISAKAGRVQDGPDLDPTLTVKDGSGQERQVSLVDIPGVIGHDLSVSALAEDKGLRIAAGSSDGRPQIWTSDGGSWSRATLPEAPERGRFTAVAAGPSGWVATGPGLLYTSPDARTWTASKTLPSRPLLAAGPGGYLIVDVSTVWRSSDLTSWTKTAFGDGTPHAITARPGGYTAAGDLSGRPVTWSSTDGTSWTAKEMPAPAGTALTHVSAANGTVVAIGDTAGRPLAFSSADAGESWNQADLPGAPAVLTVLTAGKQWFAAGTRNGEVITWTSPDGRTWQAAAHQGTGLSGPGDQTVSAAAPLDGTLTAVTVSDALTPYLWKPGEGA
ncbi:hypothetical protein GCM10010468_69710 [Actinocorallia longicatena]|uniref:Exo-alpha-sialidase n=1 Tax=Actinocorallia longicatena TaxID=111803 RepID=A0ABP6QKG8_9ACTN